MSKYTQREWDRTVGWGKVPKEYKMNDPIWDERWIPKNNNEESDNDEKIQTHNDKTPRDKSDNN